MIFMDKSQTLSCINIENVLKVKLSYNYYKNLEKLSLLINFITLTRQLVNSFLMLYQLTKSQI